MEVIEELIRLVSRRYPRSRQEGDGEGCLPPLFLGGAVAARVTMECLILSYSVLFAPNDLQLHSKASRGGDQLKETGKQNRYVRCRSTDRRNQEAACMLETLTAHPARTGGPG